VLCIIGIFILRSKRPAVPRPYKAFGYPFLPAVYILMGLAFVLLLVIYKPHFTWPGLLITLLGVPLYYVAKSPNSQRGNNLGGDGYGKSKTRKFEDLEI